MIILRLPVSRVSLRAAVGTHTYLHQDNILDVFEGALSLREIVLLSNGFAYSESKILNNLVFAHDLGPKCPRVETLISKGNVNTLGRRSLII